MLASDLDGLERSFYYLKRGVKAIENRKAFKAQPSDRSPLAPFVHRDGSAATSIAVSGKEFVERIMSRNCRPVQIRFDYKVISVGAFVGNSLMEHAAGMNYDMTRFDSWAKGAAACGVRYNFVDGTDWELVDNLREGDYRLLVSRTYV